MVAKEKLKNVVVIIVGRTLWEKDQLINKFLIEVIKSSESDLAWENSAIKPINLRKKYNEFMRWLPRVIRIMLKPKIKTLRIYYTVLHPSVAFYLFFNGVDNISFRCALLKTKINKVSADSDVIVLSRSSGGRVSSIIANEVNVKHVMCLGYPFKHPEDMSDDPVRYVHLEKIKKPMLIFQGVNDVYGGLEVRDKYNLSSCVDVDFIDTDHDFNIDLKQAGYIAEKINEIIENHK